MDFYNEKSSDVEFTLFLYITYLFIVWKYFNLNNSNKSTTIFNVNDFLKKLIHFWFIQKKARNLVFFLWENFLRIFFVFAIINGLITIYCLFEIFNFL